MIQLLRSRRTYFPLIILLIIAFALFFSSAPRTAHSAEAADKRLPEPVLESLTYLIERIQDQAVVEKTGVLALLHFARNTARSQENWDVDSLLDATGAYYGYQIAAPVDRIITHIYHPELPPSFFHPSVVRASKWDEHPSDNIPELWNSLDENEVILVRGQELEENTPDVNTGGYYAYHTDRMIVLLAFEGHKYLLSVSKQVDQSTVGRKGVVIGDDTDWNYFYSDEEGLTTGGLGWVNSYIFDSFSVTVLSSDATNPDHAQHLMFKWVRAGWSGMNMVRAGHVRNGCQRFAQSLIKLMESDSLPDIATLMAMSQRIRSMSEQELNNTLQPYIQNLRKIGTEDPVLSRRSFQRTLTQDNPLEHYSIHAKQSLVMKELLKTNIGLPTLLTMSRKDDALISFLR